MNVDKMTSQKKRNTGMMEYWKVGRLGFKRILSIFNNITKTSFAISQTLHFPRTHYSTIPPFHHSKACGVPILSPRWKPILFKSDSTKFLIINFMMFAFLGCASRPVSLQPVIESGNPFKKQLISTSGAPLTGAGNDAEAFRTLPEMTGDEYERLGDALLNKGNLHIAYIQYEKSLQRNPNNIRVECKKGLALLAGEKYGDAIRQFETVLKKKPGYVPACEGLGRAYFYKKDYVEAEKYFRRAVDMDPKLWKAHNYLGNIYDFHKKPETAIGEYKSAISVNPKAGFVYNNLGVSYSMAGQYRQAVKAFNKAVEFKYSKRKVYNNLGVALSNLKRYDQALEAFRKGGTEAQAYNNLGVVYLKHNKIKQAYDCFEKAIKIDPKFYIIANENLKKTRMVGNQL
jgi:tetratricopeptide (TPR) repeat protein